MTPKRCDNRHIRIAEAKEAGYGGRGERLQGRPWPPAVAHTRFRKGQSGNPGGPGFTGKLPHKIAFRQGCVAPIGLSSDTYDIRDRECGVAEAGVSPAE